MENVCVCATYLLYYNIHNIIIKRSVHQQKYVEYYDIQPIILKSNQTPEINTTNFKCYYSGISPYYSNQDFIYMHCIDSYTSFRQRKHLLKSRRTNLQPPRNKFEPLFVISPPTAWHMRESGREGAPTAPHSASSSNFPRKL